MKGFKLIFLLSVVMMLNSCATIRFGRSTTVTIETEHPGTVVDILAIGPKKVTNIQKVTLPYKYKARHNNLPQRLDILSDSCLYEPVTIGAVPKGDVLNAAGLSLGWFCLGAPIAAGGVLELIGAKGFATYGAVAGAVLGIPLLAVGYTARTNIPDSTYYMTVPVPVEKNYQLERWYQRQRDMADIYTMLSKGHYQLSKAKAGHMLETGSDAELIYLRGISSYYLGDNKKALADWNEALACLETDVNPGLRDEVASCIRSVERSVALKRDKTYQRWAQLGATILPQVAEKYSVIDVSSRPEYEQTQVGSPNSSLQYVLSSEMGKYLSFCRYNKRSDGYDYSLTEFREIQNKK